MNKVALVTGSAKRIGESIIRTLHASKVDVIIHCYHSRRHADALANELNESRIGSAKVVQGDLSEFKQLHSVTEQAIACFNRLDILINNASSFYPTPLTTLTELQWHDLIATNMAAPLFLSQALQQYLTKTQGVIINISDIHAERPLTNHTVYCMAKAGLNMMTLSLAKEFAPNIRVNAVAPGAILWPQHHKDKDQQNQIIADIPLNRLGEVKDIAETVKFLCLDAPYITGQIIAVDGGRRL